MVASDESVGFRWTAGNLGDLSQFRRVVMRTAISKNADQPENSRWNLPIMIVVRLPLPPVGFITTTLLGHGSRHCRGGAVRVPLGSGEDYGRRGLCWMPPLSSAASEFCEDVNQLCRFTDHGMSGT